MNEPYNLHLKANEELAPSIGNTGEEKGISSKYWLVT